MSRTIKISLSDESCQEAIKILEEYQKRISPKLDEVCRRLAEIASETARAIVSQSGDGNTDAVVSEPIKIKNGYKISMDGEDVYFVEFGTGDEVEAYNPNVSVLVGSGSWSETHAQKYMNYGYWYYAGVRLEGTPAYMPMFYAGEAIRQNEKRIVKEVFGK